MEHVAVCFDDSECQSKNLRIMAWFFNFIQLEVTWFDEVAEGLKNVVDATNSFRIFFDGLRVDLLYKAKAVSAWDAITQTMRQASYTMCVIAHRLIAPEDEEEKKQEEKDKKSEKPDFNKLTMLQGGLESRFIPELSDKTKTLIEGFFKITQDDQLRDLSLKKAEQAEKTEDDELLHRIVEKSKDPDVAAIDNVDYVELTIELLQHVCCQRKGPLLRVGGNDGMRLTRAAFSVIIKFSEQISIFRGLWDEVEMVGMGLDQQLSNAAKLNELAKELKEGAKASDFEILCKQWEQASQMRKWTQEMKKDLSESLKKECTDQMIAEINEKMKKEKEEKKEKEGTAETETKDGEKPAKAEEEKKGEQPTEDKNPAKAEGDAKKTEEEKKKEGEEEKKKEGEEDEDEDGDAFTGPLTPEQLAEVEDRAFKKMEEKMAAAITDSIKKAHFLLKMMIPEAYQKQKSEDLQKEISRKQSQNIQSEAGGLSRAPSIKKVQSILVVESTLNRKDTEFDWRDRLKQWNQK